MSTRAHRVAWIVTGAIGGLIVLLLVAALVVSRTQQFENFVRTQLVAAIEKATGGRAEVGSIDTDLGHFRVTLRNFILHGTEPEGEAPLARIDRLTLVARLIPSTATFIAISSVDVEHPQINILVTPDGKTNIPNPQEKSSSNESPLETVVNLAIGRFQIVNGEARFRDQMIPFSVQGEDLRARFDFDRIRSQYQGTFSANPLHVQRAEYPRLDVAVNLPLTIDRDRAALSNATFRTPKSAISISSEVSNLNAPRMSLMARGELNLLEIASSLGQPLQPRNNAPGTASLQVDAQMSPGNVQLSTLTVRVGGSSLDASGQFANTSLEQGSLNVQANLILSELASLTSAPGDVRGTLSMQALARTQAAGQYSVDGSLRGSNLAYREGSTAIDGVQLTATVQADPKRILADPFRVDVSGGRIALKAEVKNFDQYQVTGALNGIDLQSLLATTGVSRSAWGATLSGPVQVSGELKGVALQQASANIALEPNGRGIALRGQLRPSYSAASDSIDLGDSFLALPASRLDLHGSINRRLDVRFVSRNLEDLLPVLAMSSPQETPTLPIQLDPGGVLNINAAITGKVSSPVLSGQGQIARFRAEDRHFDSLSAAFTAASTGASVQNASIRSRQLEARFSGAIGLQQWKPTPTQPITLDAAVQNGDLRDLLALAGASDIPARGALTAQVRANGTVGDPRGVAEFHLSNGEAYGEPIDSLDGRVESAGTGITIPSLRIVSNAAAANLNARFDHPPQVFTTGTLQGHVAANQVALARIAAVQKQRPGLDGALSLDLDVQGVLNPPGTEPRADLIAANGNAAVQNLRYQNEALGDLRAEVTTQGKEVNYRLSSNFAGSSIRADGQTHLAADYPTRASLDIRDLPLEKVLLVSGQSRRDIEGTLGVRGQVSGTIRDPQADLQLDLTRAVVMKQPIDALQTRVQYMATRVDIPSLELRSGPNRLTASGSFTHPVNEFTKGDIDVKLTTNSMQLARLEYLQELKPNFTGAVEVSLNAAGRLETSRDALPVELHSLTAKMDARNLAQNGVSYGGLSFTAEQRGQIVNVQLDSDLAQSKLEARAQVTMAENYPSSVQLSIGQVQYTQWAALLGNNDLRSTSFDAVLDGSLRAQGPALQPRRMTGSAEFTRAEVYTTPAQNSLRTQSRRIAMQNDGPIRFALTADGIQVQQARWTGPSTNIALSGTAGFDAQSALNLKVTANADLKLLRDFDPEVSSEGAINLDAAITGPLNHPALNGKVELRDAAYQQTSMLNGISKANGVIDFNGSTATLRNFTAQSGGGNLTLNGSITRTEEVYRFDLQGRGRGVRVRTDSGASAVADAQVRLTGTDKSSLLSGDVNVRVVSFNSRTDVGSILTQAAPPMETPGSEPTLLNSMKLNLNIRMGSTTTFRTTFAENLNASADLTVRGTVAQPGMLGRVTISEGELVFFGTKYTVNEGNVSFYNPNRIEPILSMSLATTARGVSVDLVITGPVTNMNLSYRSDPPLQFSEIVALLAAGKLPTSDPVLLSRQPPTPQQSLPQMGASAVLGAAVANPIAGQLQRVFGVTQLKIDPTFTSGSELPQARLTLQQQITSDLTFTYITNVTRSDPQIVRVEWAINDNWSAIATRQENGMVGVDLFFKKRFP